MQFSLARLMLLIRKQFAENARTFLLGFGALAGFWAIILVLLIYFQGVGPNVRIIMLAIGIIFGGAVFGLHQFQPLNSVPQAIRYLQLPASHLEKILTAFLFCFLLFWPIAILIFYAIEYPILEAARTKFASNPAISQNMKWLNPVEHLPAQLKLFLTISAVGAFGGLYFKRQVFVKTALAAFALSILIPIINQLMLNTVIPHDSETHVSGDMFEYLTLNTDNGTHRIDLSATWVSAFKGFKDYFIPIGIWVLCWFKLRETEIQ